MRRNQIISLLTLVFCGFFLWPSCQKKTWLQEGGKVIFSVDTLKFDTVFTARGSSTRHIKIFNPQNEGIHISSVSLARGKSSPFRLNINGFHGKEVDNVDIAAHDSIWLFTAVTIDPTNKDNPFLITDRLQVVLNGQTYSIPITAYGQNAHYVVDSVLQTQTWTDDKPYVIIHNALVDKSATLTIQAGTRVYMHQDSRLFVQGTLKINGQKGDSVIFQGDRLDRLIYVGDYEDVPGEWGGLYFFPTSHDNDINYAVFKNGGASTKLGGQSVLGATIQINADSTFSNQPVLTLTNSVIHHSQGYGLVAFNSSLLAKNCLIAACGAENMVFFQGGNYRVYDCTISTYGGKFLEHNKNVSMGILNFYPISQSEYIGANLHADIRGCIIYGSLDTELVVLAKPDFVADVSLKNCLIRSEGGLPDFVQASNNILNKDPKFKDYYKIDLHVQPGSPAIGNGIAISGITKDLEGKPRTSPPTIGCYEF